MAANRAGMAPVHPFMALSSPPSREARASAPRRWHVRPSLWAALGLSALVHVAWSLWPVDAPTTPEERPLSATLTELPPPPAPQAAAAVPKPKPKRPPRPKPPAPETPPAEPAAAEPAAVAEAPPAEAPATLPEPGAAAPVEPPPPPGPPTPDKTLPPRVDLAYKVFLGTQGFLIGEATYRFEHEGDRYRIATVAQARGLAALFIRGRGRIESHGLITPEGLRPLEFAVERGSSERREKAVFDWEVGIITLNDATTAPIELATFDPMSLMWQAYFTPPVDDVQEITVATTRRVGRHTLTREGDETIERAQGEIATERWRRMSDDGNTATTVWLAPSLRYVPVKMRVVTNYKSLLGATLEAKLDSIRVDEPLARQ